MTTTITLTLTPYELEVAASAVRILRDGTANVILPVSVPPASPTGKTDQVDVYNERVQLLAERLEAEVQKKIHGR
jgi:hypothetical protein